MKNAFRGISDTHTVNSRVIERTDVPTYPAIVGIVRSSRTNTAHAIVIRRQVGKLLVSNTVLPKYFEAGLSKQFLFEKLRYFCTDKTSS